MIGGEINMKKINYRGFTPLEMLRGSSEIGLYYRIKTRKFNASQKFLTGFTLIEILVTVAIIGLLATIVFLSLSSVGAKGRDAKRKSEIAQIGRFLSLSCYLPALGPGEYDLADLLNEFKIQYPQYASSLPKNIKDPKIGSDAVSYYKYLVMDSPQKCALYANLENKSEPVTLPALNSPTPGGGNGVLEAATAGWNGSDRYFQYSN